ncbi:MAG: sulfite exporter TauE/SafE family protein [Henriciella sp.]|nr:sulfite exporter TauE/SafE family protein [Henriciella sp.]
MILLPALFFITALLYAAVGFGGGSTYNALLVLHGVDYRIFPSIALLCNMIVVSGGVWQFSRQGYIRWKGLFPFLVVSVPAAWIGGRLPIAEEVFIGLLGLSLSFAGLRLLFQRPAADPDAVAPSNAKPIWMAGTVGGGIGFLSGLVGIGGGIFLAPFLYLWRWGSAREIAGACSVFILVNSASGLLGQIMKLGETAALQAIGPYWLLFPAVLIGGQIGSRLGSVHLPTRLIQRMTAVLILYVSARLLYRWVGLVGMA